MGAGMPVAINSRAFVSPKMWYAWTSALRRSVDIWMVLPAILFLALLFAIPLLGVIFTSLSDPAIPQITFHSYSQVLQSAIVARLLINTIIISITAVLISSGLAYLIAYYLYKLSPKARAFAGLFVLVPFWTSVLVKSFAFVVLLGTSGLVNTILAKYGIGPVPMLFNRVGVIVGMSHFLIPFIVFPVLSNLLSQPRDVKIAARIMGANRWIVFWKVTLPLSYPGLFAGMFLSFIMSLGFYVVPALLGGRKDMMIANIIDFYLRETLNWPMASAVSVVLVAIAILFTVVISRLPGGSAIAGGRS